MRARAVSSTATSARMAPNCSRDGFWRHLQRRLHPVARSLIGQTTSRTSERYIDGKRSVCRKLRTLRREWPRFLPSRCATGILALQYLRTGSGATVLAPRTRSGEGPLRPSPERRGGPRLPTISLAHLQPRGGAAQCWRGRAGFRLRPRSDIVADVSRSRVLLCRVRPLLCAGCRRIAATV